jgi:hypothetical protein
MSVLAFIEVEEGKVKKLHGKPLTMLAKQQKKQAPKQ